MSKAGGAARGIGKAIKWAVIVGALLIIIVIVVAVFSLGSAANESEKSAAQVTPAKWAQVKDGMAKPAVRSLLGKPESTDETQVENLTMECWSYGVIAASGTYQVCFENGKVSSKLRMGGSG